MDAAKRFLRASLEQLGRLEARNAEALAAAAELGAERLLRGGRYLLFGCGHSGLVAQDAYYRAGGLRAARALFAPPVLLDHDPVAETSAHEKEEGWIVESLKDFALGPDDLLVVISTSGVNAAPVDLALHARAVGAALVVVTSGDYVDRLAPRHSSGKRLADLADQVLDNLVPYGDALVEVEDHRHMGSAGTAAGALLVQALTIGLWEAAARRGESLATYESGNLPGGMERNARNEGEMK